LAEALGVMLLDITSKIPRGRTTTRVRKSDIDDWLAPSAAADDSETEWVADQSLEERPLYGVRRILDRKRVGKVVYYLVDWQPTWETRNDVGGTMIAKFNNARKALVRKTFIEDQAVEAGK
jgi:hypothetical protein